MRGKGIILTLLFLTLFPFNSFAAEFSKASFYVLYWYNYYFDPGALKAKPATIVDSAAVHNTTNSSNIRQDSTSSDSLVKMRKTRYVDDDVDTYAPKFVPDTSMIFFKDGIPYISVTVIHSGDSLSIMNMGYKLFPMLDTIMSGWVPLSDIPILNANPAVIEIRSEAIREPLLDFLDENEEIDSL